MSNKESTTTTQQVIHDKEISNPFSIFDSIDSLNNRKEDFSMIYGDDFLKEIHSLIPIKGQYLSIEYVYKIVCLYYHCSNYFPKLKDLQIELRKELQCVPLPWPQTENVIIRLAKSISSAKELRLPDNILQCTENITEIDELIGDHIYLIKVKILQKSNIRDSYKPLVDILNKIVEIMEEILPFANAEGHVLSNPNMIPVYDSYRLDKIPLEMLIQIMNTIQHLQNGNSFLLYSTYQPHTKDFDTERLTWKTDTKYIYRKRKNAKVDSNATKQLSNLLKINKSWVLNFAQIQYLSRKNDKYFVRETDADITSWLIPRSKKRAYFNISKNFVFTDFLDDLRKLSKSTKDLKALYTSPLEILQHIYKLEYASGYKCLLEFLSLISAQTDNNKFEILCQLFPEVQKLPNVFSRNYFMSNIFAVTFSDAVTNENTKKVKEDIAAYIHEYNDLLSLLFIVLFDLCKDDLLQLKKAMNNVFPTDFSHDNSPTNIESASVDKFLSAENINYAMDGTNCTAIVNPLYAFLHDEYSRIYNEYNDDMKSMTPEIEKILSYTNKCKSIKSMLEKRYTQDWP